MSHTDIGMDDKAFAGSLALEIDEHRRTMMQCHKNGKGDQKMGT